MLRNIEQRTEWSRGHNFRGRQAKDLKKSEANAEGQGPTFRGQTPLRPRTGMVEARRQGHNFSKLWSANFPLLLSA